MCIRDRSAALPWDESNASSGLLYPRDAIIELSGFYAGYTPFSKTNNLVIIYDLNEGKSSIEYDNDIRLIAIRISNYLAELTRSMTPDRTEEFSTCLLYTSFYFDRIITPQKPIVKANILKTKHSKNRIYLNCRIFGIPETLLQAKK